LSGLRAHYDQAGLLLQKKEEAAAQAKLAARQESLADQKTLIDYKDGVRDGNASESSSARAASNAAKTYETASQKAYEAWLKGTADGTIIKGSPEEKTLLGEVSTNRFKANQARSKAEAPAQDPLGIRKPAATKGMPARPAASEAQMRSSASGDMGPDPKAIQREIQKATADLAKVKDAASAAELNAYIADLNRQYKNATT